MTTAAVSSMTTVWKQTSWIHRERRKSTGEAVLFKIVGHFGVGCKVRGYPDRLAGE